MNKNDQKLKFKLSLIYGLNLFIKIVFKGQFYLFTATFLGLLTYYVPQTIVKFSVKIALLLVSISLLLGLFFVAFSGGMKQVRAKKNLILLVFFYLFVKSFEDGNSYIQQHVMTESLVIRLFMFWIISLVLAILVNYVQPILFKNYLFKKVINKEYLGLRKEKDLKLPQINLFEEEQKNE